MTRTSICLASLLTLASASTTPAQEPRKSPHEKASLTLSGKEITIEYGRPSLRGRKAVGGTLVPYGQVWRTGADEAPKLTTTIDLTIGGLKVPAGQYALFTLPTPSGWTLIVSKNFDQWGAFTYDHAQDLGRVPMQMSKPPSTVEQFTMAFQKTGDHAAKLTLSWENTTAAVNITAP
jgi:hypothetical protein